MAQLRNTCRRPGIQVGTIDALIAQPCIRHELKLLSTNKDFDSIAKHCALRVSTSIGTANLGKDNLLG